MAQTCGALYSVFVIVSEFVWYSLVSGSIQMAIFIIQHMCVKYCRRLQGGILIIYFFKKKKKVFHQGLYLCVFLYGYFLVQTDLRVSMPLGCFLSCWAHWFALNILLSILYCWDKLRGNVPSHRNAVSVKKGKLFVWVKRSLFSCPHLSPVVSPVCLYRVFEVP